MVNVMSKKQGQRGGNVLLASDSRAVIGGLSKAGFVVVVHWVVVDPSGRERTSVPLLGSLVIKGSGEAGR